jgi:hypothetical protein
MMQPQSAQSEHLSLTPEPEATIKLLRVVVSLIQIYISSLLELEERYFDAMTRFGRFGTESYIAF